MPLMQDLERIRTMKTMFKVRFLIGALITAIANASGCAPEFPSCPVEQTEGEYLPPEGGETEGPGSEDPPVQEPSWPSGDGLANDERYKRLGDGQICRCNMGADELCSRTEPVVKTSDASCDLRNPEGDPDCAGWATPDGVCDLANPADVDCAQPSSPSICGEVFWCCYAVECVGYATRRITDFPICPSAYGHMGTRYMAFAIWSTSTRLYLKKYKNDYGTKACYVIENNCRAKAGAGKCGNYPEN